MTIGEAQTENVSYDTTHPLAGWMVQLQQLFPDAFSEGRLERTCLAVILGLDGVGNEQSNDQVSGAGDVVIVGPPVPDAAGQPVALAVALIEITRVIAISPDVSNTFSGVAHHTRSILAHDALTVLLLHTAPDAEAHRKLVVAFCDPPALEAGLTYPLTDFSFGPALLEDLPVVIEDLR